MRRNVSKKIDTLVELNHRPEVLADIDLLQGSPSHEVFDKAVKLFTKKWKGQRQFMDYLKREWLLKNRYWYEGAAIRIPSTNNAIESFNAKIKNEATIRHRLPIGKFLLVIQSSCEIWSKDTTYDAEVEIPHNLWRESYQWARANIKLVDDPKERNIVYVPVHNDELAVTIDMVSMSRWTDLKHFREARSVAKLKLEGEWTDYVCTCLAFQKKWMCKHVLGIAIRQKKVTVPPTARDLSVGPKPKRGRPKKVTKALSRM